MVQLREAVEKRKSRIIRNLIASGFTKCDDGRQLYELTLSELEYLNQGIRTDKSKSGSIQQVE